MVTTSGKGGRVFFRGKEGRKEGRKEGKEGCQDSLVLASWAVTRFVARLEPDGSEVDANAGRISSRLRRPFAPLLSLRFACFVGHSSSFDPPPPLVYHLTPSSRSNNRYLLSLQPARRVYRRFMAGRYITVEIQLRINFRLVGRLNITRKEEREQKRGTGT